MPEDKNEQSSNPKTQSAAAGAQTGNQGQRDEQEQGHNQEQNQPGGQQSGGRQEPAPTTQQDKERERQ